MKKLSALLILSIILSSIPLAAIVSAKSVTCKMVYVYEEGYAKPEGKPGKPPKPDPEPEEPQLYELMGPKWKTLELNYVINPTNNDGLDLTVVEDAITDSVDTWDGVLPSVELFYNGYLIDDGASVDLVNPYTNNRNEIVFGNIPQTGAIAVCLVWYTTRGPPSQRGIIEFDIVFDDVDFKWGNAGPLNEEGLGDTSIMDLQNIATHELGHALGLADLYFAEASEQTMFGYGTEGETKKRTMNTGDVEGITVLYG